MNKIMPGIVVWLFVCLLWPTMILPTIFVVTVFWMVLCAKWIKINVSVEFPGYDPREIEDIFDEIDEEEERLNQKEEKVDIKFSFLYRFTEEFGEKYKIENHSEDKFIIYGRSKEFIGEEKYEAIGFYNKAMNSPTLYTNSKKLAKKAEEILNGNFTGIGIYMFSDAELEGLIKCQK